MTRNLADITKPTVLLQVMWEWNNNIIVCADTATANKDKCDSDLPCHYLLQKDMHVSFHAK